MPHRNLAVLTLLAAAGCSSGTTSHNAAPGTTASPTHTRPVDAVTLAALATRQETTALPPATGTTAQAVTALAATLPQATATAGYDQAAVATALAFTARLVAVTRLDRTYLCGPQASSPASALSTPFLRTYLAKPGKSFPIEVTIGSARKRDNCGTLRWVGPGVSIGSQHWTVGPTPGSRDLLVRWTGTAGYALADAQGHPEPWRLTGHAGYELARAGTGWALDTWAPDTNTSLNPGWPHDVPIPTGYLPSGPAPTGDPTAVAAVRGAAAKWAAQASSTTTVDGVSTGTDTQQGRTVNHITGTGTAAPARGDAATTYSYDGGRTATRSLYFDRGRRGLTQVTGKPTPVPGKTVPTSLLWLSTDNNVPSDGEGITDSPFAVTALLARVDAAAPASCPTGLTAARCYTAVIATGYGGDPLAGQTVGHRYRNGHPYLVLAVGLDSLGRPSFVRVVIDTRSLGTPTETLTGTTRFTAYGTTPPPPVTVPDPATVAPADDVDF